jgi:hypothetical protein
MCKICDAVYLCETGVEGHIEMTSHLQFKEIVGLWYEKKVHRKKVLIVWPIRIIERRYAKEK